MKQNSNESRRRFLQNTAITGASIILVGGASQRLFAEENPVADAAKRGRAGRSEEVVSVVLRLCSPGASYVIGHGLTVDGGLTVV